MRRMGFGIGLMVLAIAAPALAQQPAAGPGNDQVRAAQEQRRAAVFVRLDANHDGMLSLEEWSAGRQAAARQVRQRQIRQQLRRMDVNRDRAVSREEWRGTPEVFDRLDADKDGKVTGAEMRRARRPARGSARRR